ncbi:MAG TPA: prepilin-type N-terminal cleavage/methylation domain-containing protein [Planctomycetota bacterium]|nr:prepilin-type N-terminal cleavage/methylation domain-containing protein [Planctomycetota bacterium]
MKGPSRRFGFTLIEMLVVIVIIMILAAILIPTVMRAICQGRQASMKALISQLETACKSYETDHNVFPESNAAFDSAGLARALSKATRKTSAYFEFKESQIGQSGNIVNPVYQGEDYLKYRNNQQITDPKLKGKNKSGVDMWARGCDKVDDSINNWE